jgi:hypothetical protein
MIYSYCPGVDVIVTIFCDLTAKEMAFFLKTNFMIHVLQKLAVFCTKNGNNSAKSLDEFLAKIV